MDDRKGKETEYQHAEELDLGGGFSRATDTRMYERGEPERGADRAWRGRQRISQHMTQKPAPEVMRAERKNMQALTGTKREITIMLWDEQIAKAKKRLADSRKCDNKDWIAEDKKNLAELEQHKREAIAYMDEHGIM